MIKFFRRIRQQLLSENKFSKYLIYAIGEIILVVIGILIALSINNWNEERKLKDEATKMLRNFKTSIKSDSLEIGQYIGTFNSANKSIHILLNNMDQNLPYHDSLSFHFTSSTQIWNPRIDQEVFASLTSTDLNIISNDSLKKEIISYYSFVKREFDVNILRYSNIIENASTDVFKNRFNALWNYTWDNPDENPNQRFMIPNDYEALKKDKEFNYFLRSLKNQLFFYIRSPLEKAQYKSESLLKAIDRELMQLEK